MCGKKKCEHDAHARPARARQPRARQARPPRAHARTPRQMAGKRPADGRTRKGRVAAPAENACHQNPAGHSRVLLLPSFSIGAPRTAPLATPMRRAYLRDISQHRHGIGNARARQQRPASGRPHARQWPLLMLLASAAGRTRASCGAAMRMNMTQGIALPTDQTTDSIWAHVPLSDLPATPNLPVPPQPPDLPIIPGTPSNPPNHSHVQLHATPGLYPCLYHANGIRTIYNMKKYQNPDVTHTIEQQSQR